MRDHILVTGGSGKTGSRIAANLRQDGASLRLAQRSASGEGEVRFDWTDASTYDDALEGVRAAYLVAPTNVTEPLEAMQPFLEKAISKGVERFVLLSASMLEDDGPMMGKVHGFLRHHAPHWTVLRPTWFMQNFSEQQHLPTIREEGVIYSATGDGRVPFIDAGDIAAVAAKALTTPDFPDRDLILTGPEALSYDQVAGILSNTLGREIVHRRLTESELAQRFAGQGMAPEYAAVLAAMDTAIAAGAEDRMTDEVLRVTNHPPTSFQEFAAQVQASWKPNG